MVKEMTRALIAGDVLAIFPEGTTGDGIDLLPFHANLIQSAIEGHSPVQPLALQFVDSSTNTISMAARFIGDDTLLGSIWSTLNARGLKAVVNFGELQFANGRNRRAWAQDLHEDVKVLKQLCEKISETAEI
jgi:1-acyl-sn-glycerol-3-phosphate acyltransferase